MGKIRPGISTATIGQWRIFLSVQARKGLVGVTGVLSGQGLGTLKIGKLHFICLMAGGDIFLLCVCHNSVGNGTYFINAVSECSLQLQSHRGWSGSITGMLRKLLFGAAGTK
jgi:hypothetical protein